MPVRYHTGRFPPASLDWGQLIPLLGPAAAAVARYDGMLAAVPNPAVLLSPLTTQEAVLSSRIEGTQATMGEVFEFEASEEAASPERREDIREILNYRAAMREGERLLADLPLSQRVIREMHKVLLAGGVRGQNRAPGEYRRIPNWIGPPGCSIEQARFVPIDADKLPAAMSAWERYAHSDAPDRLVQLAILHAELSQVILSLTFIEKVINKVRKSQKVSDNEENPIADENHRWELVESARRRSPKPAKTTATKRVQPSRSDTTKQSRKAKKK